jgi:hypothetical protein
MSAFAGGVKRTLRDHRKSVAADPKRYFATANYRIAKGDSRLLMAAHASDIRLAENMEYRAITPA